MKTPTPEISPSPPSARTTVRRKPQRARYDAADIHAILDEAWVCHVAFNEGGSVHSVPMVGWRVDGHLYLHGANNSRIVAALLAAPCSVSIALVDGLVLARSSFRHSMNFRSVVVYGQCEWVADDDEVRRCFAALVDHVSPGRSAQVRPPNAAELAGTRLLRLSLNEAAAKVRAAGCDDKPGDLDWPVWAGVLPLALRAGSWVPQPDCGPYGLPTVPTFVSQEPAP